MRRSLRFLLAATLCLWSSRATAQSPADPQAAREAARPIAAAALSAYEAKDFATALSGFQQADSLYPTPHYRIYIARAYKRLGKLEKAARAYEAAVDMQIPANAPRDFAATQSAAAGELAEIRPRIPILAFSITGAPNAQVRVAVDGAVVATQLLERYEADPGEHTILASAPRFKPIVLRVQLNEGSLTHVPLKMEPQTPELAVPTPLPPFQGGLAPPFGLEKPPPQPVGTTSSRSHRWKPGVLLRGDVDPIGGGVLFAPGLSIGLFDYLEIGASALIGPDVGVEPMIRGFILSGAWKPLLEVAAPIFIVDGGRLGIRGAAGVQWDFHNHFGVFAEIGGAYFPDPPADYQSTYFLPSFGVQGRL